MIPSYIRLRYESKCASCNEVIPEGTLAFYDNKSGRGGCVWHSKCGSSTWKIPGSPYDIRIKTAIAHKQAQLSPKDQIKLALRRFRRELSIPVKDLELKSEIYSYLKLNKLIDYDDYKKAYVIVPKGFSWDVDKNCVRMATYDEDIMERDQELEMKVEE